MTRSTAQATAVAARILLLVILALSLQAQPLRAAESADTQLFVAGFNAYQTKEYGIAVEKLNRVLTEYPGTPLRDMTLFWLARAAYRAGDRPEAAKAMSQFLWENPGHPLRGNVEAELLALAEQYDRGVVIARAPDGVAAVKQAAPETSATVQPDKAAVAAPPAAEKPVIVSVPSTASAVPEPVPAAAPPTQPIPPLETPQEPVVAKNTPPPGKPSPAQATVSIPPEKGGPVLMPAAPAIEPALSEAPATVVASAPQAGPVEQPPSSLKETVPVQPPVSSPSLPATTSEQTAVPAAPEPVKTVQPEPSAVPPVPLPPGAVAQAPPSAPFEAMTNEQKDLRAVPSAAPDRATAQQVRRSRRDLLREKAIAAYQRTIDRYPDTPAAAAASARLARLTSPSPVPEPSVTWKEQRLYDKALRNFRKRRYSAALADFDRLISRYPKSPLAPEAALYRGECYLKLSRQN